MSSEIIVLDPSCYFGFPNASISVDKTVTEPEVTRGKALGYRAWEIGLVEQDIVLQPLFKKMMYWEKGCNTSTCDYDIFRGTRSAPCGVDGCHCGFNAWNQHEEALSSGFDKTVYGAVTGWGNIQIHRDGWRAEYSEIIALFVSRKKVDRKRITLGQSFYSDFYSCDIMKVYNRKKIINELKRFYEVPVFTSKRKFKKYVEETKRSEKLVQPRY